jgi:hypothetical protein
MKMIIKLVAILTISLGGGIWAYQNTDFHYFFEEYYVVQNLDPHNEKSAETLRQKIQSLIQKTIPVAYRPHPDKFQCFKFASESVFFCSVDTFRRQVATHCKKLLQETIPQEIGWISKEDADQKLQSIKDEVERNAQLIAQDTKALEKNKGHSSKNAALEKKFNKSNDLYKKSVELYQKKLDLITGVLKNELDDETRQKYISDQAFTQQRLDEINREYSEFKEKNKSMSEVVEERQKLEDSLKTLREKNVNIQKNLDFIQTAMAQPNNKGRIANVEELQLLPDASRRKYEIQKKRSNVLWFSLFFFMVLSNIFISKPRGLIAFEDATVAEPLL